MKKISSIFLFVFCSVYGTENPGFRVTRKLINLVEQREFPIFEGDELFLNTAKGALIAAEVGTGIGSLCLLKQKEIKGCLFFAFLAVVSELVRKSLSFTHRDLQLLNAFYNASKIIIPKNVRFSNGKIPNYFFKNCDKASEIVIDGPFVCKKFPQNVEKIIYSGSLEGWDFARCPRLTTVTDSDHPDRSGVYLQGLKTIPYGAFNGCRNVQSVHGPDVTLIQGYAFSDCSSLKEIKFPNVVTIEKGAFRNCENLTNIEAPNVETIDYFAFLHCSSLEKIKFPKLTTIGYEAFCDCESLTDFKASSLKKIQERVFLNCGNLMNIEAPNVETIDHAAFCHCSSLEKIKFPKLTTIGASSFDGCDGLIDVDCPEVTTTQSLAFCGCPFLEVNFPNTTTIAADTCGAAFDGCKSLVFINIPKVKVISFLNNDAAKFLNVNKDADIIELRPPFVNLSGFINSDEIFAYESNCQNDDRLKKDKNFKNKIRTHSSNIVSITSFPFTKLTLKSLLDNFEPLSEENKKSLQEQYKDKANDKIFKIENPTFDLVQSFKNLANLQSPIFQILANQLNSLKLNALGPEIIVKAAPLTQEDVISD